MLLEIPDRGEKDSLFSLMDGLAGWAKMELQRRAVQTLVQAMQVAESLIEFKKIGDSFKPKDKRGKPAKGGREKEKPSKEFPPKPAFEKGKFAAIPIEDAIVRRS